ncbi:MAG: HDOD domain-containing protein [Pseudomonadota bacterium]
MTSQLQHHGYELSHEDIERVLGTIDIPTCPAIVTQVLAEAQKDDPDMNRLAKTIESDVGMAAIAIKFANSPLFRVGAPVTSVRQALPRLGTRNVVCVVVATALRATMAGVSPGFIETFWKNTAAIAQVAGLIARKQYGISPDAAFTYALFHDAGIPLMMRRYPDYQAVVDKAAAEGVALVEAEDRFYPCTHPIIGSLLVRNWGLPPLLGLAIRFHHEPDVYDLPDSTLPGGALSLVAVVHIAEHLGHLLDGVEDLDVGEALYQRALAHFGIHPEETEDFRDALVEARASQ